MRRKRKFRVFDYEDNIENKENKEYKAINDLKEIDKTMIEINEKLNNILGIKSEKLNEVPKNEQLEEKVALGLLGLLAGSLIGYIMADEE